MKISNFGMKSVATICLLSVVLFLSGCSTSGKVEKQDFSSFFDEADAIGTAVIYDSNHKISHIYNEDRAHMGLLPASTFKIYNSLIALETGVVPDENFELPWDGKERWRPEWNRDHTLESAIENSVVWYYQEVARRIGEDHMQTYLDKLNYGNRDMSAGIDRFWLEGGMRITALEQIELLKQLYSLDLPVSERSQKIVKKIITLESTETYTLSGKTGGLFGDDLIITWFVGYVETQGNVYFFAVNAECGKENYKGDYRDAKQTALKILKSLNII